MAETLHLHIDGLEVAPLPNGAGVRLTDKAGNQVVVHGDLIEIAEAGVYITHASLAAASAVNESKTGPTKGPGQWPGPPPGFGLGINRIRHKELNDAGPATLANLRRVRSQQRKEKQ